MPSQKAIGKKCWEVFPSPFCRTSNCRLKRILDGEELIQAEIERVKPNGETIPCSVRATPSRDDSGKVNGVIETFTDIKYKLELKKKVEESEDRYRALVELGNEAGEAILMLQNADVKEGIQTFVSDQWPRITGYTREELLGMSFFELVSPDDRQVSIERHRQKISGKAVPGLYEIKILRKDGVAVHLELTGAYSNYQGEPANVLYIRDITERQKIENILVNEKMRYTTLFYNAPVALAEGDWSKIKIRFDKLRSRRVVDFKKYLDKHPDEIFDYANSMGMINANQAYLDLVQAKNSDEYFVNFNNTLRNSRKNFNALKDDLVKLSTGLTKFSKEQDIQTNNGITKRVIIHIVIMPGCESSWSRIIFSLSDITELKQKEKELKSYQNNLQKVIAKRTFELAETNKQLQEQINQRIDFTRALVHELRTPLTTMLGAGEILSMNLPEGINSRIANNLLRGTQQLNVRVMEMMDIARGEIGVLKIKPDQENLQKLLQKVADDFMPIFDSMSAILKIEEDSALPDVMIDAPRIEQVLQNLINNALYHSRRRVEVKLTAKRIDDHVQINIVDNGPGISKEMQKHLFEMYYKSDIEAESLSGLGIGLALCKILVELHGGKIWVNSIPGIGSTFSFTIPLA